mgnify:CR=1 FL=1
MHLLYSLVEYFCGACCLSIIEFFAIPEVEKEGIKRAFKAMEDSVLRVMLVDVTDDVNASVKKVLETSDAKDTMIVLNKVDLTDASEVERVKNQLLKEYPKIRGCVSI